MNRQGAGLAVIRILIGVFFIFGGRRQVSWLLDAGILAGRLTGWLNDAPPGSASRWYLEHVAMHGIGVFARLVPLGELAAGVALVAGVWTHGCPASRS